MPRQTTDDDESSSPPWPLAARRSQRKPTKLELSSIESNAASLQISVATPRSLGEASLPAIDRESSRQGRRQHSKQSSESSGTPVSGKEISIPSPARKWASRRDELCSSFPADPDQSYAVGALANDGVEDALINQASKTDSWGYALNPPASSKSHSFWGSGRRFGKESTGAGGQAGFNTAGTSRHPSKESAGARRRANPEESLRGASKESVGAGRARANTDASVLHPRQEPAGSRGHRKVSKQSSGAGSANADGSVPHPSQEPAGSREQAASSTEGPCNAVSSFATQPSRRPSKASSKVCRQEGSKSDNTAFESSNSFSLTYRRSSKVCAKTPLQDDVKNLEEAATSGVSGSMLPVPSVWASPRTRMSRSRQASKGAVDISDGVRQQAMSPVGEVPIHELADIHGDHGTKAPKSSPAWLSQVAREAAASSTTCDANETWTSPSGNRRAAVLGARLLLSDENLGGRNVEVQESVTARERWGRVRTMTSKIRSMLAKEKNEVSVSDEVTLGQLDDSSPLPMRVETQENAYWNRLWDLAKLQRPHVTDEDCHDVSALLDNLPEPIMPDLPGM